MRITFTILSFFLPLSLFGNEADLKLLIQGSVSNNLKNIIENANSKSDKIYLEIQKEDQLSERLILNVSKTSSQLSEKYQLLEELQILLGSSVQIDKVGISDLTIGTQDDMM